MKKVLTREDILKYHNKGFKIIELDEYPILTDLAKEAMKENGVEIRLKDELSSSHSFSTPQPSVNTENLPKARKLSTTFIEKAPFKEVIRSEKKIMGTFLGTPHPVMSEFIGHCGFDFVCIDAEHNAMHYETVQKMLQGLQGTSTYGMVRVPTISYEYISGALDIGADALLIPQIRTVEDIEKIRQYSLYPPKGRRGCGPSRIWDYGDSIGQLGTKEDINYATNVVAQIETVEAVKNIEDIVNTDFIDMFFIGPGDLSMDMGIFAQFDNPKLISTIMQVRSVTEKAGKKLGIFAGNFEAAEHWCAQGFDMCIINSELALLSNTITEGLKKLHRSIGD